MSTKLAFVAAALIGATSTPATAQENPQQTPENAVAFLQKLAARGNVSVSSWRVSTGGWDDFQQVLAMPLQKPCYQNIDTEQYNGNRHYYAVFWDTVAVIRPEGDTVEMAESRTHKVRLSFTSPDLAARAAQAMEVIRASCDATAGTGF